MRRNMHRFVVLIAGALVGVALASGTTFGVTNLLCNSAGCTVDFANSCTSFSGPINFSQLPACGLEGYVMTWTGGAWACAPPGSSPIPTNLTIIGGSISSTPITGGSINNTPIGGTTPATGAFTTLRTTGDVTFDVSTLKVDSVNNRVGIGTASPETRLHVTGGQWDVATTEGDVKIGDATNRLKIGVATSGGGAGIGRIHAAGTNPKVVVGAGGVTDVLAVTGTGVGIGTLTPAEKLAVAGNAQVTGEYNYAAPKTYYKWLGKYDFTSLVVEITSIRIQYGPVQLPDGADVQKIVCYLVDQTADASWVGLNIHYVATNANGEELKAIASHTPANTNSAVATGYALPATGTVSGVYDPVDNTSYHYHLAVFPEASSDDYYDYLKFTGCRIEYKLSTVSP